MCARTGIALTCHHLIPKSTHSRKSVRKKFDREQRVGAILMICKPCHKQIHVTLSEKELAMEFNTREALLAQADIARFVEWISSKPPGTVVRTNKTKQS